MIPAIPPAVVNIVVDGVSSPAITLSLDVALLTVPILVPTTPPAAPTFTLSLLLTGVPSKLTLFALPKASTVLPSVVTLSIVPLLVPAIAPTLS